MRKKQTKIQVSKADLIQINNLLSLLSRETSVFTVTGEELAALIQMRSFLINLKSRTEEVI